MSYVIQLRVCTKACWHKIFLTINNSPTFSRTCLQLFSNIRVSYKFQTFQCPKNSYFPQLSKLVETMNEVLHNLTINNTFSYNNDGPFQLNASEFFSLSLQPSATGEFTMDQRILQPSCRENKDVNFDKKETQMTSKKDHSEQSPTSTNPNSPITQVKTNQLYQIQLNRHRQQRIKKCRCCRSSPRLDPTFRQLCSPFLSLMHAVPLGRPNLNLSSKAEQISMANEKRWQLNHCRKWQRANASQKYFSQIQTSIYLRSLVLILLQVLNLSLVLADDNHLLLSKLSNRVERLYISSRCEDVIEFLFQSLALTQWPGKRNKMQSD